MQELQYEASKSNLVACPNCGRTFNPDRIVTHQRICKGIGNKSAGTSRAGGAGNQANGRAGNQSRAAGGSPTKDQSNAQNLVKKNSNTEGVTNTVFGGERLSGEKKTARVIPSLCSR